MDHLTLSTDDLGHLICDVSFGSQHATVSCFDSEQGMADLKAAFQDALRDGAGECYWREATGEYRWVFRKTEGGKLRVAVLWSNGTMTGWDQLIWAEAEAEQFEPRLEGAHKALGSAPA